MNVRELCSCGSEFRAIGDQAVRLLREWRKKHTCPDRPESVELRDVSMNAQVERIEDATFPELRIGFRPNEDDEEDD